MTRLWPGAYDHGAQHAVKLRGAIMPGGGGAKIAFDFLRMMEPGTVEQDQAAARKRLKQFGHCPVVAEFAKYEVEGRIQPARIDSVERLADVVVARQLADVRKETGRRCGCALPGTFADGRGTKATA